jgi:phosphoenolpyruvate-protein kinase (PTS system EI component)
MRKGIPVSPGVSVGKVYCVDDAFLAADARRLDDTEISAELARYETAREKTAKDLRALQRKVQRQIGHEEAAIFGVHESILHDSAFTGKIRGWIVDERMTVLAALHRLVNHYTSLFARTKDEYIKERLTDVRDVVMRLSRYLSKETSKDGPSQEGPLILVANELLPSQVVALGDVEVRGISAVSFDRSTRATRLSSTVATGTWTLTQTRNHWLRTASWSESFSI